MSENAIENIINNILQDRELAGHSSKWANWESKLTPMTCKLCVEKRGTIFDISILENRYSVHAHEKCKCVYVPMRTKKLGTVTDLGENGADVYLVKYRKLPDYYLDKDAAIQAGWKKKLSKDLPGRMIGGDIYNNKDKKLPYSNGRVWYEADINYVSGKRNRQRILYSNDGLIFVTYDHYQTFYEVTH